MTSTLKKRHSNYAIIEKSRWQYRKTGKILSLVNKWGKAYARTDKAQECSSAGDRWSNCVFLKSEFQLFLILLKNGSKTG